MMRTRRLASSLLTVTSCLVARRLDRLRGAARRNARAARRAAGAGAVGHRGRGGREPLDRSFPARHRLAAGRRTGRRQRRDRPAASSGRRSSAARACAQARVLIRISATETEAQLRKPKPTPRRSKRGSASSRGQPFDPMQVPDVLNAKASLDWAEAEFNRIKSLLDQKVVSQSEFDQRRTQVEAARQQYQMALNAAQQSYQSLQAARARVALARKALGRHRRPRAVLRPRRRAPRQHRRLRHPRRRRSRRSSASIRCASS